jgi:Xaa-Pro aminopeptidase
MDFKGRQARLRDQLRKQRLDAFLVTYLPNIRYLCGFTGSAGALLITPENSLFFTDGRYTQQAKTEVQDAKVVIVRKAPLNAAAESLDENAKKWSIRTVGFEADHLTVATKAQLSKALSKPLLIRPTTGLVERLRLIKDADEIRLLRHAVIAGARLFDVALRTIRAGVKETKVAAEMEFAARRDGAERMSFDTIVASGPRSALPHGRASQASIPARGFVVCDFGVILAGYCSDMTRTAHVGKPGAAARGIYEAVKDAQQFAVDAVRPGIAIGEVDRAARSHLQKKGLVRYFTHSTGHGVGLEIHEAPRIAAGQTERLQPGMVITIEPGVYLQGKGGVRIEDMVVVTDRGCEVLTPTPKELITI